MLIIRGVNVFPSQIEAVLAQEQRLAPHYVLELRRDGRGSTSSTCVVETRVDRRRQAAGGRTGRARAQSRASDQGLCRRDDEGSRRRARNDRALAGQGQARARSASQDVRTGRRPCSKPRPCGESRICDTGALPLAAGRRMACRRAETRPATWTAIAERYGEFWRGADRLIDTLPRKARAQLRRRPRPRRQSADTRAKGANVFCAPMRARSTRRSRTK